MGDVAKSILTVGLIGGTTYLIARSRQSQSEPVRATPASFTVTTAPRNGSSFRNGLLGALGGIISQSTGGNGGGIFGGIFGRDKPTVGEDAGGVDTSPVVTGFGQQPTGARLKRDLMRDFGFTSNQAAGIVGNLHVESAGFQTLQEIQPMEWQNGQLVPSSTNRGGYGYAQWTGPRRRAFEAWVSRNNLNATTYAANYGFLKYEMTSTSERRVVSKLKATRSVEDATRVFMVTYLRPGIAHVETRISFAQRYA